jgi:uncharacterized protein (UPF0332 family)
MLRRGRVIVPDYYTGSINRSYYAIFDCMRALLHEQDIFAKTHKGTQSKFNECFIKTEIFDPQMGKIAREVFELRQTGDYDFDAKLSSEDAKSAIEGAAFFVKTTRDFLQS